MRLKFGQGNVFQLEVWMKNYNLFWKEDNMLTGKQKRFLRAEANQLKPIFQVGKIGVNENMVKQIAEALEKRELIKVSIDRKSTRLNSSHVAISYAVFCLKKKKKQTKR